MKPHSLLIALGTAFYFYLFLTHFVSFLIDINIVLSFAYSFMGVPIHYKTSSTLLVDIISHKTQPTVELHSFIIFPYRISDYEIIKYGLFIFGSFLSF